MNVLFRAYGLFSASIYLLLPIYLSVQASSKQSVTIFSAFRPWTSRHIIGGPINLISVYSYERFHGYIFMVFKILSGFTTASACTYYKRIKMVWGGGGKRKVTNTIERIYFRISSRLSACRAEGKPMYIYDPIYLICSEPFTIYSTA